MDTITVVLLTWIIVGKGYTFAMESPFFFTPTKGNWSFGESYCKRHYGRMLTIETQSKYDLVMEMDNLYHDNFILRDSVHIGLFTSTTNCTNYVWVSGNSLDWSKWLPSQPLHCTSRLCIRLQSGQFRTTLCHSIWTTACEYVTQNITNMMTTEKPATTETVAANVSCNCCTRGTNFTQHSPKEALELLTQLKAELYVSKEKTSVYRRKRVSVYEQRPSSMVIGGVASLILSIILGCIVVSDLVTLCAFLFKSARR